ncbi:hypothetical protein C8F04DRAFT_1109208 [Mycena alexandri]|uniref:RRM domain-containing protein n=1 Tax=Mycena alexandri TaxID=1745969 RepID=A0AAD6SQE1_9AGAR|nr:hypothetical protein C8F04DRAFT_1109208 [Mycena alexandri]
MSTSTITKRLHISFTPSVPANGPVELAKSLTAHFGKFGTVKSVDGLGELDGVGLPRKFGFVSIEGSEAGITKCVNSLSGSIWKGVKVRVGDARPNFDQRIAQENAEEPAPARRKRKRSGVHAEDMTPVTPDIAAERSGWKVTEMGRVIRPLRIRPARPLPPPLVSLPKKLSTSKDKDSAKPKKRRDPDSRSRRRTIDMMRWGSVHLKGIFLEDAGQGTGHLSQDEVEEMVAADQSDSPSEDERVPPLAVKPTVIPTIIPAVTEPLAAPKPPILVSNPIAPRLVADQPVQSDVDVDLLKEKNQSLSLLNSLFGAQDGEWGGRESVGSDVDEDELLKIGGTATSIDVEDAIEFVPMDVDVREPSPLPERPPSNPKTAEPKKATQATRLKDLFVSRNEDVEFSLLGHLDLDLELDDEFAHVDPEKQQEDVSEAAPATFVTQSSHTHITLDPKQPLFFPLPTSFSSTPGLLGSTKARQRDILDVGKDNGWPAHFCRNETDEEIRKKWEEEKVGLTREWNRRWREAGKVRRRRGGCDGD